MVRSDLKGRGLGRLMMRRLIAYAVSEGIGELWGRVLRENSMMLSLCEELGFVSTISDEPALVRVSLPLRS
jgi:acetyltransferase